MDPMMLIVLLLLAFAVILVLQVLKGRARVNAEEKVMKGYFLLGLSGLMAKIAQADGTVTMSESEMASRVFGRMALTDAERAMCVGNFITSRTDGLSPRDHAKRFIAYANPVACEFLYDLLWRISRADGQVAAAEDKMLQEIATYLGLSESAYTRFQAGTKPHYVQSTLRAAGVPESLVALARA